MGRIDVRYYFTDDRRNNYHIDMTDHTQGPQYVLDALCKFIFDTGINVPKMRGWVAINQKSICMYWVDNQCPLFALLDFQSKEKDPRNFLCFKRNGNQITINHFGPFGWEKTSEFIEEVWRARDEAINSARENENVRKCLEELRKDYNKEFPTLGSPTKFVQESTLNEKDEAIAEMEAKVFLKVRELELRKAAIETAVKAGKDIAIIIAKETAILKAVVWSGVKKIPVLGFLAGLGFGTWRALHGDFFGASMEVASGSASLVPGGGTAASLGIDAALLGEDISETTKAVVWSGVKKIPVLGFLAGLGFGTWRALHDDLYGASMEVVSGTASLVPGGGTAASLVIDAALLGKGIFEPKNKVKEEEEKQRALYNKELREWRAVRNTLITLLDEKIIEYKDAEDGYNHYIEGCDRLICLDAIAT